MIDKRSLVNGEPEETDYLPVMPAQCSTCPFGENDALGVKDAIDEVIMESLRICHHHQLAGKEGAFICRGALLRQCEIFHGMGFLSEPTIDAWDAKCIELGKPEWVRQRIKEC